MKQTTVGVFEVREDAENAVARVHKELRIPSDDISFLYRNTEGQLREVEANEIGGWTPAEGASAGAWVGAVAGILLAGVAALGIAPFIESIYELPIMSDLSTLSENALLAIGVGGAVATFFTSAIVGALLGALIGALVNVGAGNRRAYQYQDRARSGDILVAVNAPEKIDVRSVLRRLGAMDARVYRLSI